MLISLFLFIIISCDLHSSARNQLGVAFPAKLKHHKTKDSNDLFFCEYQFI